MNMLEHEGNHNHNYANYPKNGPTPISMGKQGGEEEGKVTSRRVMGGLRAPPMSSFAHDKVVRSYHQPHPRSKQE
jgi:hypothetical protein